jgi:hypothetical protein
LVLAKRPSRIGRNGFNTQLRGGKVERSLPPKRLLDETVDHIQVQRIVKRLGKRI